MGCKDAGSASALGRPHRPWSTDGCRDHGGYLGAVTASPLRRCLEEIARYYQQLESRADWLESALEETLLELDRVSRFKLAASTPEDAGQPLAPPVDPMP